MIKPTSVEYVDASPEIEHQLMMDLVYECHYTTIWTPWILWMTRGIPFPGCEN